MTTREIVERFIEERCEKGTYLKVASGELHLAFAQWADTQTGAEWSRTVEQGKLHATVKRLGFLVCAGKPVGRGHECVHVGLGLKLAGSAA